MSARIKVQPARLRLFGADVGGRPDKLRKLREDRLLGQLLLHGLGDAKVNHLRDGHAIMERDQDVRRLDVAVNNALLMRVLDGMADEHEEPQSVGCGQSILIAVVDDRDTAHEFHHEIGPARVGRAGIENPRDVGVVHHGQRLTFGFEPGHHLSAVHAQLDDFERHAPLDGCDLVSHPDFPESSLADLLQQLEVADPGRWTVARCGAGMACERGLGLGRLGQKPFGGEMGCEELFQPNPQAVIVVAYAVEKRSPFGG